MLTYTTVWTGATWREADPPPPHVDPVRRQRVSQAGDKARAEVGREGVRACFTDGAWRTAREVIEATSLSERQAQLHLMHGMTAGWLERELVPPYLRSPGRPGYRYRLTLT